MAVLSFSTVRRPIAEMRATEFKATRDVTIIGVFGAAAALLIAVGLPAGERMIPLTAVAAIAIGWTRSFRETWSIGNDWITYRRWVTTRVIEADDLVDISLVTDVDDRVETIVLVSGLRRIPVPMHEVRDHPDFAVELRHLLAGSPSTQAASAALALL